MARKLRVEYEGAIYHLMNRGDRKEPIFRDDSDRLLFLETLRQACAKTDWRVHAYCLMNNHFHLVVETPKANLVSKRCRFLVLTTQSARRHESTTGYSYDAVGQLLSEDGPWANDTVSYTYENRLRKVLGLTEPNASAWVQTYRYDVTRRLTDITSPAGSFSYQYPNSQPSTLISQLSLPGGSYITNAYDNVARLLNTTLKDSSHSTLNSHQYSYNPANQRTQQVFTAGNYVDYTYDSIGQLKTAKGKESGGTGRLIEQMTYTYDAAGNLILRINNSLLQFFAVNSLNQLTNVGRVGSLAVAGTTTSAATGVTINGLTASLYSDNTFARSGFGLVDATTNFTAIAQDSYGRADTNTATVNLAVANGFIYDSNGNLRTNRTRIYDYDDENQLIRITESNAWKAEFTYDGKMRRKKLNSTRQP